MTARQDPDLPPASPCYRCGQIIRVAGEMDRRRLLAPDPDPAGRIAVRYLGSGAGRGWKGWLCRRLRQGETPYPGETVFAGHVCPVWVPGPGTRHPGPGAGR